jgi:hypothetical protein
MNTHTLRLDPRLPVVWQHPHAIQVGVDPAHVVITDVDDRVLTLLHGLKGGMTKQGLTMLARENGLPDSETARFLGLLEPVLTVAKPLTPITLVLDSPRSHSRIVAQVWRLLGHRVERALRTDTAPSGEVIIVADFVLEPEHHHRWLRLDRTHTPLIFLDQSIRIGPRVIPGETACLHCVRIAHRRENPHAVAIWSQLWGKQAPTRTPELEALAAWHCLELISQGEPGQALRIDAHTREIRSYYLEPEPECECTGFHDQPGLSLPAL